MRLGKPKPNLNLVRDRKGNKKGFYKYIGDKRKARENMGTVLNRAGELVTQDMEKGEVLKARLAFLNPRSQRAGGKPGANWRDLIIKEVPEDWRKANATPLFKNGKKGDPGNYRSVNLTSIPGEVMEQLLLGTISRYMKEEKVIRSSQHGFTKGKSCLTKLITFYDKMTGLVEEGGAVDVVSADSTKVFETVCPQRDDVPMERLMKHGRHE
ncbi:hypothetical protein QYF61_010842 [Mycteria americana]|uniref:Reverse transcriptase domain-containing protein n=1 Tax=Mycteria americana TaxID=33587 RepID=A0AAN7RQF7_MYCAM|nr:hypothetical protein QYF61_010842 [Mycteria americana]